ncbi:RNase adapter RapZ [Parablastomonas sp. CN1-191]|uniref:RNase adapter RapZ n=1 Tax=Parablastomonas sp. CN1-191 TaxID=3400908 RepID=UPI003BF7A80B
MSDHPPQDEADGRQRLLLVTGLAGAGRTTALHTLEDSGWETIDNLPIRFLDRLIGQTLPGDPGAPLAIGFDSRTRDFSPRRLVAKIAALSQRDDIAIETLFLDCSNEELERRYNETRRRHPQPGMPAADGIAAERELLDPVRRVADTVIVTTTFTSNDLQQAVRERYPIGPVPQMTVSVTSFGFARGMPPVADLVFDMRFLDNPHWVEGLREQTGRDRPVADHVRADPAFAGAFVRIRDLLLFLLPRYAAQGKPYVNVAFGCTGGRHRSVFMAEEIAKALRTAGFAPTLLHRNLDRQGSEAAVGAR